MFKNIRQTLFITFLLALLLAMTIAMTVSIVGAQAAGGLVWSG